MTDFEASDDEEKVVPLRAFTHEEVREFCVSIKKFTEQLERQLIIGEMADERKACANLFGAADELQSLLP